MTAEKPASPRIFRVAFSVKPRRVKGRFIPSTTTVFIKVPYAGLFGVTEMLARAMTTNQIIRFEVRVARPGEITPEIRASLQRWTDTLNHTTEVTAVDWSK